MGFFLGWVPKKKKSLFAQPPSPRRIGGKLFVAGEFSSDRKKIAAGIPANESLLLVPLFGSFIPDDQNSGYKNPLIRQTPTF